MTIKLTIESQSFKGILKKVEKEVYERALLACQENKTLTAKLLGITRTTLLTKLKEHFGDKYYRGANK